MSDVRLGGRYCARAIREVQNRMIPPVKVSAFAVWGAVAIVLSPPGSDTIAQAPDPAPQLRIDEQGVSLVVQQRRSRPIPGSNGSIVLSIGDITGGMVMVSLNDKESASARRTPATVLRETPLSIGELAKFKVEDRLYSLFLRRLNNELVGDDTAEFNVVRQEDITKEMKEADAAKRSKPQEIKVGERIDTNVSGTLEFRGIDRTGSAALTLDGKPFAVRPSGSVNLTHDEILEIVSVSGKRDAITIELYHPAPFPRPF